MTKQKIDIKQIMKMAKTNQILIPNNEPVYHTSYNRLIKSFNKLIHNKPQYIDVVHYKSGKDLANVNIDLQNMYLHKLSNDKKQQLNDVFIITGNSNLIYEQIRFNNINEYNPLFPNQVFYDVENDEFINLKYLAKKNITKCIPIWFALNHDLMIKYLNRNINDDNVKQSLINKLTDLQRRFNSIEYTVNAENDLSHNKFIENNNNHYNLYTL